MYVTGKISSCKSRPPTLLTEAEEQDLCDWALLMADIDYERIQEQLCATVKEML